MKGLILGVISVGTVISLWADEEPPYCNPTTFSRYEVAMTMPGLRRAHAFQIGSLTLIGLAVGQSRIEATQAIANAYSQYRPEEKSCTWYYNRGNESAQQAFNHKYVSNPAYAVPGVLDLVTRVADEYESELQNLFDIDPVSFLSCAVDHNYLAMGCDGMMHRGPTVFAMFLAFTGCSPENAVRIADDIWGNNWVTDYTRVKIAERAYELGAERWRSRQAFQQIMR